MHKNPRGREIGFGRRIRITEAGVKHPLFKSKPPVFEALTVHLDEVESLPLKGTVLAMNDHSGVQAAEIQYEGGVAWGVQYHPELKSRPFEPHPLFASFIEAAKAQSRLV